MLVSIFKDLHTAKGGQSVELLKILDGIKEGRWRELVEMYREWVEEYGKSAPEATKLKKSIPVFTASGTFPDGRGNSKLEKHSEVICIDFDFDESYIDSIPIIKEKLCTDIHTFACFYSVSGCGLAVMVKINPNKHIETFKALELYYLEKYNLNIDRSCKDVARTRIVSYDPDLFLNETSRVFETENKNKESDDPGRKFRWFVGKAEKREYTEEETIKFIINYLEKQEETFFEDGSRNSFCFKLACRAASLQLDKEFTSDYIKTKISLNGFPEREIDTCINSGYEREKNGKKLKLGAGFSEKSKDEDEFPFVYYQIKSNGEVVHKVDPPIFIDWLSDHLGFGIYRQGEEFYYVQVVDNIITRYQRHELKNFVSEYLKKDMFTRSLVIKKAPLMGDEMLHFLKDITNNVKLSRDPKESSYFYFKSNYYRVDLDEIRGPFEYKDMDWFIWNTDIIDHDIELNTNYQDSDFYKFLQNITKHNEERLNGMLSVIGYMLHTYKDKSNAKSIVLCDEDSNPDEANGGTGKTLIYQMLKHVRGALKEDGKMFRADNNKFIYQRVTPDTKILVIDDVSSRFRYDMIFSVVTGSMSVERKGKTAFEVPFELSPKILITTNYMMKQDDESHARRFVLLELFGHYNSEHTPFDDFGKRFFDDFSGLEWNQFFTLMMDATKYFLNNGIQAFESESLPLVKLMASTSTEFVDYAQTNLQIDSTYYKKERFEDFTMIFPDYKNIKRLTQHKFSKWIKMWAKYNGWGYHEQSTTGNKDKKLWFTPF